MSSSHHPYDAYDDDLYDDAEARFLAIEHELDEAEREAQRAERDGGVGAREAGVLFAGWVGTKLAAERLDPQTRTPGHVPDEREYDWFDAHIAESYESGRSAGQEMLEASGHTPSPRDLSSSNIHQRSLHRAFDRQREYWNSLSHDLHGEVRTAVTEAMRDGTVDDAVSAVRDRIEHVGKYRAELIAQSETSYAFNSALLSEYEEAGVTDVRVGEVEWSTAGDEHVCVECASRSGTYEISRMRQMLEAGEFPHHPRCRCLLLPSR